MKTILFEVSGGSAQDGAFQAALDLVRATNGHLTCVQVKPYTAYVAGDAYDGAGTLATMLAAVDEQCRDTQAAIEKVLAREGISWDFERREGDAVQALAGASRLADAIVVAQHHDGPGALRPPGFNGALALAARAPVIVVPAAIKGFAVAGSAMIAWNGSFEAAQAVRAALPLLALAETVDVVTVGEIGQDYPATAACKYLSRHGIHAELLTRNTGGDTVANAVLAAAFERGSAYLVTGAYGHSRLREYVLGGVTRSLLASAPLPLVLAH